VITWLTDRAPNNSRVEIGGYSITFDQRMLLLSVCFQQIRCESSSIVSLMDQTSIATVLPLGHLGLLKGIDRPTELDFEVVTFPATQGGGAKEARLRLPQSDAVRRHDDDSAWAIRSVLDIR
jgi:hypothetical protein